MTARGKRHLRLIPGDAQHVLIAEIGEECADVVCTCGEQWPPLPVAFLDALAEHHEGAIYA